MIAASTSLFENDVPGREGWAPPIFISDDGGAEVGFIPDAAEAIGSLVVHQGSQDLPAKRH
jgi:hypothetical protein